MSRLYERKLLIERGVNKFNKIEEICFNLCDYFEIINEKLLLNYKSNGKFKPEGKEICFTARVRITPELMQDLYIYGGIDVETELLSMLSEHIHEEAYRSLVNRIFKKHTNFKSILIEKKSERLKGFRISFLNLINKLKNRFNKQYTFFVSAEMCAILDDIDNFYIHNEVEILHSMGLEVSGYLGDTKENGGIRIIRDPYLLGNRCFVANNIEESEFFVDFNTVRLENDLNAFTPYYGNHIINVNMPENMKYQSFEVLDIEPYSVF